MYLPLTYTVELLAVFVGIIRFNKFRKSSIKYFIIFLIVVFVQELFLIYTLLIEDGPLHFLKGTIFEKNHWVGKIVWLIGGGLFYSFFYRKILKKKGFINILKLLSYGLIITVIILILMDYRAFFLEAQPVLNILAAIIIILGSLFYYIEILTTERVLTFYNSVYFYISSANLIWWLLITPVVFFDIYFNNEDWNFVILKWQIFLFANIFMYLTFALALNYCKPEND